MGYKKRHTEIEESNLYRSLKLADILVQVVGKGPRAYVVL